MQLKFKPPSAQTPGYLLRVKKALKFRAELASENPTPETIDALVAFLLDYVTEPEDRTQAEEALYMATQEQFNELLEAVTGDKNFQ